LGEYPIERVENGLQIQPQDFKSKRRGGSSISSNTAIVSNWEHDWDDSVIDRSAGRERVQSYDPFSISSVLIIAVGLCVGIRGWIG
jgi:hypothetical protein